MTARFASNGTYALSYGLDNDIKYIPVNHKLMLNYLIGISILYRFLILLWRFRLILYCTFLT